MPSSVRWSVKVIEVYCEPASACPISSSRTTGCPSRSRAQIAIRNGTSTSSTALVAATFQATIFWAKTSTMNAVYTNPAQVRT